MGAVRWEETKGVSVQHEADPNTGCHTISVECGSGEEGAQRGTEQLEKLKKQVGNAADEVKLAEAVDKQNRKYYSLEFPNRSFKQSAGILRTLEITEEEKFKDGEKKYKDLFDKIRDTAKEKPMTALEKERQLLASAGVTPSTSDSPYQTIGNPRGGKGGLGV